MCVEIGGVVFEEGVWVALMDSAELLSSFVYTEE